MNIKRTSLLAVIGYVIIKWALMLTVGGAVIKAGLWRDEFFLLVPVIAITILVIRHRRREAREG